MTNLSCVLSKTKEVTQVRSFMRKRLKTIRLTPAEHEVLKRLYLEKKLGRDRYAQFPIELRDITGRFNGITSRNDSTNEICHYIRTQAKQGYLGTLGDDW